MRVNFKDIPDEDEFPLLPPGRYPCSVEFAENDVTQAGAQKINLTLKVDSGPYAGQRVFDSLFSTEKALKRLKLVSKRLGIDPNFDGDLMAEMFIGRRALITTKTEVYDGKERAKVTFDGYESIGEAPAPIDTDDDVPF